ncbi:hypothetical protein ACPCHT_12625 [Nucisporomicrobium flavum]|jgi:hypothetical protein|uniref:hypothetical protein n=1 Tax=Nucisporomicrobium flavum TaxID=2785915 RepID=UPI0018F2C2AD|nr:hypothetical protein [Nucisporomicrobium flavum]
MSTGVDLALPAALAEANEQGFDYDGGDGIALEPDAPLERQPVVSIGRRDHRRGAGGVPRLPGHGRGAVPVMR